MLPVELSTISKGYSDTDEYRYLVEECQDIWLTRIRNAREEVILAHGQLGERIVNDPLFKKYAKGNGDFLRKLAEDTRLSYSEVCRSIQFYETYNIVSPASESWSKLPEGNNISWNKIKMKYLTQPSKETITENEPISSSSVTCPKCGFRFTPF